MALNRTAIHLFGHHVRMDLESVYLHVIMDCAQARRAIY